MTSSILKEFLLFDLSDWTRYSNQVFDFCSNISMIVFLLSIVLAMSVMKYSVENVLLRYVICSLIITTAPSLYKNTVSFGFKLGDEILKTQERGIIKNWLKYKQASLSAFRKKNSNNKKVDQISIVSMLFNFDSEQIVEQAASLLIFILIMLIKVIYSVVYYSTYSLIPIFAVLQIFPFYNGMLLTMFKSILYQIITAILIALVLTFLNEVLVISVSKNGFVENMAGVAKFLILCFVLLGTLFIGKSVVNMAGPEAWAANMGKTAAFGGMLKAASLIAGPKAAAATAAKAMAAKYGLKALNATANSFTNASKITSKPLTSSLKNSFASSRSNLNQKASNIKGTKTARIISGNNQSNYEKGLKRSINNSDKNSALQSFNPKHHVNASKEVATKAVSNFKNKISNSINPNSSKNMSIKDKLIVGADSIINKPHANKSNILNMRKRINKETFKPVKRINDQTFKGVKKK